MSDDADFRGDCGRCAGLCCVLLSFDRGPHFAFDKAACEACRHLGAGHRCTIHSRLAASGMAGCAAYDCRGAGQLATAMFGAASVEGNPARQRALADAFVRLRALQTLRLVLRRFGRDVAVPHDYAGLLLTDLSALRREVEDLMRAAAREEHRSAEGTPMCLVARVAAAPMFAGIASLTRIPK